MKKLILFITMTALALPLGAQTSKKGTANRGSKQTTQVKTQTKAYSNKTIKTTNAIEEGFLDFIPPTPEHKVYTGDFQLNDNRVFRYQIASYSYLSSPTGERIFDGPFKHVSHSYDGYEDIIDGNFKNNRQVGNWKIATIEKGDTTNCCTFHFNDLGLLDGEVMYFNLNRYNLDRERLSFLYSMGRIEGPVAYNLTNNRGPYLYYGAGGSYQNNEPIGSWYSSNYPHPIVLKKDQFGNDMWETTTVDESTGDKTTIHEYNLSSLIDIFTPIQGAKNRILQLRDSKVSVYNSRRINLNSNFDYNDGYFFEYESDANRWIEGIKLKNKNSTELSNRKYLAKYILDNISLPTDVQDTVVNVFIPLFTDNEDKVHILKSAQDTKTIPAIAQSIADVLKTIDWKPYPRDENGKYEGKIFCLNFLVDTKYVKQSIFKRRQAAKEEEQRRLFPEQEPTQSQQSQQKSDGEIYATVDQQAEFPGGVEALFKWLSANLIYPKEAQEIGIEGKVGVKFVVNTDGSISDIQVSRSVHPSLDAEAIRLVKKMPKWQPAKNNGVPVRSYFTLPFTFRLQNR